MYGKQLMMITKNGMNPSVSTEISTKNENLIYTNFIQKAFGLNNFDFAFKWSKLRFPNSTVIVVLKI